MQDMTFEEVVTLERNIKIKNKAKEIVAGFKRNVSLNLAKKNGLRFEIWSDEHNSTYVDINEKGMTFVCCFLHENYSVDVNESSVFSGIANGYRGIDHLASAAKVDYNSNIYKA